MEKSVYTRDYATFLALLRETRQARGLTQVDLAQRLGETQSFISKCERGERRLDVVQLGTFCRAMGIPLEKFIAEYVQRLGRPKRRR